jgi:hypothetical protein
VLKNSARIEESLAELSKLSPSREQLNSFERGLATVVKHTGGDAAILDRLQSLRF